jgi:hypothetical protein
MKAWQIKRRMRAAVLNALESESEREVREEAERRREAASQLKVMIDAAPQQVWFPGDHEHGGGRDASWIPSFFSVERDWRR